MPSELTMKKCSAPSATNLRSTKDLPALKVGRRTLPEELSLPSTTVLSKADYERIQYQLNRKRIEEERLRRAAAERQALHELSQKTVKNWTNTVLGARQKKLAARKAREEREEQERIELDIEEAKLQAKKRREIIDKAKTQLYYETDRVKHFHSALRYTETLKERDAQVELNNLRRNNNKQSDIDYRKKLEQDYQDFINGQNEDQLRMRERNATNTAFLISQIDENQKNRERELELERLEAEKILQDAEQFREEERCRAAKRAEIAKRRSMENRQQIEDVQYMRQIDKLKEDQEDEECRMFALAKTRMMKMRMDKEQEMEAEKLARLDRIRDKLAANLAEKVEDEESRIKKAQEELEAKKAEEERDKIEKRRKTLQEIKEHRIEDMKHKEKLAAEERANDLAMLKARQEADLIISANEEKKLQRRKEEALKFSKYHLDDMDERQRQLERERAVDMQQWCQDTQLAEEDENQFQDYARRVIEHCRERGRNVYPLEKASEPLKGYGLGPVYPGRGPLRPIHVKTVEFSHPERNEHSSQNLECV